MPLAVHMAAHGSMQTQSQGWLDHHSQQQPWLQKQHLLAGPQVAWRIVSSTGHGHGMFLAMPELDTQCNGKGGALPLQSCLPPRQACHLLVPLPIPGSIQVPLVSQG